MGCILVKRFETPDTTRAFEKGRFDLVQIGGLTLGRARYAPGWKWSDHVGAATGRASCDIEHVGIVISGQAAVRMDDGEERVLTPGDIFEVLARSRQLGRGRRALRLHPLHRGRTLREVSGENLE